MDEWNRLTEMENCLIVLARWYNKDISAIREIDNGKWKFSHTQSRTITSDIQDDSDDDEAK